MDNKPKDNNFDKDDFYHNEGFVETQGPIGLKIQKVTLKNIII